MNTKKIDKYYPMDISDLIINPIKINNFINWLDNFNSNASKYRNIKKKVKLNITIDDEETIDNISTNKKNIPYDKNTAIITGAHGVGKTLFVMTILKEKKYNTTEINFEKINKIRDINEYIDQILKGINIFDMINNNKRAIVIDNIEIKMNLNFTNNQII